METGAQAQIVDAVRNAIDQLPAAQRELVTLVHWEGFTLAQAADVIGISTSTARGRYASARAALARKLSSEPGGVPSPRAAGLSRRTPAVMPMQQ